MPQPTFSQGECNNQEKGMSSSGAEVLRLTGGSGISIPNNWAH